MSAIFESVAKRATALVKRFQKDRFGPYCCKSALLVAALMIFGLIAPQLSIGVVAVTVVAYALLSTCGQLYGVVIRRKHKQFKLEADGKLSSINRRWVVSLIVSFVASLISGILFILEAPRWELPEWALLWAAIPGFFVIYEIMQNRLSGEFKPWALKADALRWSFVILAILLCIVYAIMGMSDGVGYSSLDEAFQKTTDPFKGAESVLLSELSYVSTFADGLTNYGLGVLAGEPHIGLVGIFVARFLTYAFIIFGLASQYGCCLLTKNEIECEFRLLPDVHKKNEKTPFVKRYFVTLSIIVVAFFSFACLGENLTKEVQGDSDYSCLKQRVDSLKHELILRVDEKKDLATEAAQNADKGKKIDTAVNNAIDRQRAAVNEYYDAYKTAADSYIDLYYNELENPINWILRFFGGVAADQAFDKFKEQIEASEISDAIEEYGQAKNELSSLVENTVDAYGSNDLGLFDSLDEAKFEEMGFIPQDGESREECKKRINETIESARTEALNQIDNLASIIPS